ncbi:MAG: hypothetical protein ACD_39C01235G0007 [uncultured bacterium]|nr:MAG: hypothetical protein ACD_39C01235G0007 [uncultured bacterium]
MNLFEAGVSAGAPTGAAIGGVICKSYGILGIAGGALAGMMLGVFAGWIYAVVVIGLLGVIGGIWRGVCKRSEPSEADMRMMTRRVSHGIFVGALCSFVFWMYFGWLPALVVAFAIASVYSFAAVAQCELR